MLDIDTGKQTEALYKLAEIQGGKRIDIFKTTNIKEALDFHANYVKRNKRGLYMEIVPKKKVYNWKEKKVDFTFE